MRMKIYTRRGDEGDTGLLGGGRVAKDHPRLHAYGTVDELSSCLGLVRGQTRVPATAARLARIQRDLFAIGASLARPPASEGRKRPPVPEVPVERVAVPAAAGAVERHHVAAGDPQPRELRRHVGDVVRPGRVVDLQRAALALVAAAFPGSRVGC